MSQHQEHPDIAAENARLGAMLAGKGLSPEQVATVMRDQVQPTLNEALRLVEAGADIDEIRFEVR